MSQSHLQRCEKTRSALAFVTLTLSNVHPRAAVRWELDNTKMGKLHDTFKAELKLLTTHPSAPLPLQNTVSHTLEQYYLEGSLPKRFRAPSQQLTVQ